MRKLTKLTANRKPKKVYLLESGAFWSGDGVIVAAARTKAAMLRWIKQTYPTYRRERVLEAPRELFYECHEQRAWLRCRHTDRCVLIEQ